MPDDFVSYAFVRCRICRQLSARADCRAMLDSALATLDTLGVRLAADYIPALRQNADIRAQLHGVVRKLHIQDSQQRPGTVHIWVVEGASWGEGYGPVDVYVYPDHVDYVMLDTLCGVLGRSYERS